MERDTARRSGLTSGQFAALRLYDLSGLLPPAEVDPVTGYRRYHPDQLERARRISLLRQLDMPLATVAEVVAGTGLEWREQVPYDSPANGEIAMMLAPDRWRYVLERPVVEPPGTRWNYSGGASELIGWLVARGTGVPLPEYARDVLFDPLGIGAFEWMAGHDGVASSASGLRLTPRDLARIGQAVLAGGRWRGRQVIPASWLDRALRPRVETAWGDGYGYQWYRGGAGRHQ